MKGYGFTAEYITKLLCGHVGAAGLQIVLNNLDKIIDIGISPYKISVTVPNKNGKKRLSKLLDAPYKKA